MNLLKSLRSMLTPGPRVAPADALERVRKGDALLVDVREPGEWSDGVAEKAVLLPLSDLSGAQARWKPFLAGLGGREVLVYCASGMRSGRAAQILTAQGIRAANTGGLGDWAAAGWPIVSPRG